MILIEEIQNGENVALEFKEARPKDSLKFTKTVVAFANGKARYFADLTALRLEQLNGTAQVPKVPVPGNVPEELDDGDVPFQNLGRTTTAFCKVRW